MIIENTKERKKLRKTTKLITHVIEYIDIALIGNMNEELSVFPGLMGYYS